MELVRMSFACEKGIPLEDVKKKGSGFPAYKDRVNCGHEGKILSCMPLQFEIDGVVLKGTDLSDKEVTLSFQDRKAGNEAVRKAREEGKTERADLNAAREVRTPARAWSRSGRVAGRPAGHGACCGVRGGLCRRCDAVVPSFFLVAAARTSRWAALPSLTGRTPPPSVGRAAQRGEDRAAELRGQDLEEHF